MLIRGDLLAGRFEVQGDQRALIEGGRGAPRPSHLYDMPDDALWLPAVDRQTGAPVRIVPRGAPTSWLSDYTTESIARRVMAMELKGAAPVLHVGSGVVFAEPPLRDVRPGLSVQAAAECALQACEVLARLHAAGFGGQGGHVVFGPTHVRVVEERGRWQLRWIVPGLPVLADELWDNPALSPSPARPVRAPGRRGAAAANDRVPSYLQQLRQLDTIAADVWQLVAQFFAFQEGARAASQPPGAPADPSGAAALATLARIHREEGAELPVDVASLARLFLPLLPPSAGWAARVDALPAVSTLPDVPQEWDRLIEDGERQIATVPAAGPHHDHIAFPLAAAYHQRASLAWAQGKLSAALRDADRAVELDTFWRYRTTRAILLDALGHREEANREIDAAIAGTSSRDYPFSPFLRDPRLRDREVARAYATRGRMALSEGALAKAEKDLRHAMDLCPSGPHAHALGAVLYARGDLRGAAKAEDRSVAFEPKNTRYRWALVKTLMKLGLDKKAREHASLILAIEPDVAEHRERHERLFGSRRGPSDKP